ncbi:MAG: zinc ribbon domain-containing protein, partial [Chthonomonadaceae bacterium]|nr:zinc ribbon domain-containing protein [Chthonomonadaceae bacterium]
MSDVLHCMQCHTPLAPTDTYCPHCGRLAAHVRWSLSAERQSGGAPIMVRPGGTFYVAAENLGQAPVRVEVDTSNVRGAQLQGLTVAHVEGHQTQVFAFRHCVGEELAGTLRVRSREERRQNWWERAAWRDEELRISGVVRVRPEQWLIGSEAVVFPPGVQRQRVRIWNDSEEERTFSPGTPAGYVVQQVSGDPAQAVPPGHAVDLTLQVRPRAPGMASPDREWRILP